ncbi:MAG: YggT family protein [Solirubrobacteraceae bacterium]|nr:YggT family protein [Patulibacter sp.]
MNLPAADVGLAVSGLIQTICDIASTLIVIYVLLDLARNFMRGLPDVLIAFHQALARLFEPIFRPIRNALPDLGGLDFSPLIVIVALQFISRLVA